jgi:hypothetical protein
MDIQRISRAHLRRIANQAAVRTGDQCVAAIEHGLRPQLIQLRGSQRQTRLLAFQAQTQDVL